MVSKDQPAVRPDKNAVAFLPDFSEDIAKFCFIIIGFGNSGQEGLVLPVGLVRQKPTEPAAEKMRQVAVLDIIKIRGIGDDVINGLVGQRKHRRIILPGHEGSCFSCKFI